MTTADQGGQNAALYLEKKQIQLPPLLDRLTQQTQKTNLDLIAPQFSSANKLMERLLALPTSEGC